jgi:CDP-2,3-bis-(O-geranylgeranyl)-sn-glycerol synthase
MSPVFAKKLNILKFLDKPVDFNKKFRGKRILGKNKTFRGFATGIITATIVIFLQTHFYSETLSILPYQEINFILLGTMIGFFTLFGDTFESFFKRQLNIAPGKPFIPFDQIDSATFALLGIYLVYPISLNTILLGIALTFLLTLLSNSIGYLLGIKEVYW